MSGAVIMTRSVRLPGPPAIVLLEFRDITGRIRENARETALRMIQIRACGGPWPAIIRVRCVDWRARARPTDYSAATAISADRSV